MFHQPSTAIRFGSALWLAAALGACSTDEVAQKEDPAATGESDSATVDSAAAPADAPAARAVEVVPYEVSALATQVVEAEDRTDKDRDMDGRRHPAELLSFIGVQPGWRVADLGTGAGYTLELLNRAVGPDGQVYGQNNAHVLKNFVSESWPARLARPINANTVRLDREFADVLPDDVKDLDAVTFIFSYHDVVAAGGDRAQLNREIYDALKPGGVYVIADHHAPEGSGLEAASTLHRLERDIVVQEVTDAGFVLVEEGQFLRDPTDDLQAVSYKVGFRTDRYVLKFQKQQ